MLDPRQFTKDDVRDILYNVFEIYDLPNSAKFWERFESRLNDKGLNWNNGANDNKLWDFHEDEVDSFIYEWVETDSPMDKIISNIDVIMDDIDNDANKTKLPELSREIIELQKICWDAERLFIKAKNKYENDLLMKKESWKSYLQKIEDDKFEKDNKYKKVRITSIEIQTQAELELLAIKKLIEEPQLDVVYLKWLILSYYDRIKSVKFTSKEMIQEQKTF